MDNQIRYDDTPQKKTSGMAIASMVLGIVSVVSCCTIIIPIITAIIGFVLGIVSLKQNEEGKSFAIAGIITSVSGFLLVVLMILFFLFSAEYENTEFKYYVFNQATIEEVQTDITNFL